MKIWCQGCGAYGKDPIWDDFEQVLRKHAREIPRPGTEVEIYGLDRTVPGIDRYHASKNICMVQGIKNAIRAEREGYDAFIMTSTYDAGYHEIREVVDMPVLFILEVSLHFALMFAPRFGFVTHNKELLLQLTDLARQYGLAERMVPGVYLDLTVEDWRHMYKELGRYKDMIVEKAKGVVANGAGVLIPSGLPLGMFLIRNGITEINGARVLDSFGCVLKMAELLVDLRKLGITRTKYGSTSNEVRAAMQKLYVP